MGKYIEQISNAALFYGIKKPDLEPMLNCLGVYHRTYSKGEYIYLTDEQIACVGFVLSGKVHMIKEDIWGNKTILTVIKKNEIFGETFACGSNPLSAVSFCAMAETQVLFLPFDRVMKSCSLRCVFHHRLIENMVALIADKNRRLMEKVEIISKKTLREKILAYLSLQAQMNQGNYFEIPLGRVELAEFLCADRSALTRELSLMQEDGLIDFEKNTFRILQ